MQRAYDLARDGEEVVLEPRRVRIDALSLLECPDADTTLFEARCGKGTYVRAIARDMGRALGALGHVVALAPDVGRSVQRARCGDARGLEAAAAEGGPDDLRSF